MVPSVDQSGEDGIFAPQRLIKSYDPRYGFQVTNLLEAQQVIYDCRFSRGDFWESKKIILDVKSTSIWTFN